MAVTEMTGRISSGIVEKEPLFVRGAAHRAHTIYLGAVLLEGYIFFIALAETQFFRDKDFGRISRCST
jgi:hypothetical protein